MDSEIGVLSISPWEHDLPSGGQSSELDKICLVSPISQQMRTLWPDMLLYAKSKD